MKAGGPESFVLFFRNVLLIEGHKELGTELPAGAFCDGKKLNKFVPGVSFEAFSDVRED